MLVCKVLADHEVNRGSAAFIRAQLGLYCDEGEGEGMNPPPGTGGGGSTWTHQSFSHRVPPRLSSSVWSAQTKTSAGFGWRRRKLLYGRCEEEEQVGELCCFSLTSFDLTWTGCWHCRHTNWNVLISDLQSNRAEKPKKTLLHGHVMWVQSLRMKLHLRRLYSREYGSRGS